MAPVWTNRPNLVGDGLWTPMWQGKLAAAPCLSVCDPEGRFCTWELGNDGVSKMEQSVLRDIIEKLVVCHVCLDLEGGAT
jgi:hypothetical protein